METPCATDARYDFLLYFDPLHLRSPWASHCVHLYVFTAALFRLWPWSLYLIPPIKFIIWYPVSLLTEEEMAFFFHIFSSLFPIPHIYLSFLASLFFFWCYVTLGHLAWDVLLALLNPFFSSLCQTYYIYVEKGISSLNEYVHERKHPSTILHTSWTTPVLGSPIDQCILPEPYKHIPLSIRALPGHFSASTRRRRKVYLFSALTCLSYFLFDIVCDPSYPAAIWLQTEYGLSTLFGNTEAIDDYWLAAYLILPDWWSLNSVIYFSS